MSQFEERAREEISQAKARLAYVVVTELYLLVIARFFDIDVESAFVRIQVLLLGVTLYALFLLYFVRRYMVFSPLRQGVTIAVDIGAVSYVMFLLGGAGAVFYPLYLWIISGNGLRFGMAYLWFAMGLGFVGFAVLVGFNDYWLANLSAGIGLLLGVLILPSFFAVLIRRLHQLNQRLQTLVVAKEHLASHDDLTGLCNRYCFNRRLAEEIARAERNGLGFSLLYLDLDGFKPINDSYGHDVGDLLLKSVADRLRAEIRSVDLAVRLGGDEFAVLTMAGNGDDQAGVLVGRIEQAITAPHDVLDDRGNSLSIGVSIGVATYPLDGTDAETLMRVADTQMYRKKG